jgi:hypothetical protein
VIWCVAPELGTSYAGGGMRSVLEVVAEA